MLSPFQTTVRCSPRTRRVPSTRSLQWLTQRGSWTKGPVWGGALHLPSPPFTMTGSVQKLHLPRRVASPCLLPSHTLPLELCGCYHSPPHPSPLFPLFSPLPSSLFPYSSSPPSLQFPPHLWLIHMWRGTDHKILMSIYKQRTFIYTGQEDRLLWTEYGISLYFPSTPSQESQVLIEGTVSVRSAEDHNYRFPVRSDLVSAVYGITADKEFPVPVTVQIEHCIPLHDDDEAARLGMSFMTASRKQGPPYEFRDQDGGSFRSGSSFGEITLFSFSYIVIRVKWWLGRTLPFFASVFYTNHDKAFFVVTQNLAAHITVSSVYI